MSPLRQFHCRLTNGTEPAPEVELRQEVRQLKRQVATLEEEKAILAKAAAWFAKETIKTPNRSLSS
ncbi:MAG: hypothetical protein OXH31_02425 [Gammaproteobacteria bacterium]|nr:hypothetical protein [Gammaproteobacteria bacterium]